MNKIDLIWLETTRNRPNFINYKSKTLFLFNSECNQSVGRGSSFERSNNKCS